MVKLIGAILLLYGAAGIVGSLILYQRLRTPIERLRLLLRDLAVQLGHGGAAAKSAAEVLVGRAKPVLEEVAKVLPRVAKPLDTAASHFREAGEILRGVGTAFHSFAVTVPAPIMKPLDLSATVSVPTGVTCTEYSLRPAFDVTVCLPPIDLKMKSVKVLDLGTVNVMIGIIPTEVTPLDSVGDGLDSVAGNLGLVHGNLKDASERVIEMRDAIRDEAVPATETAAGQLTGLGDNLENARTQVSEIGQSRLLTVAPLVVIGYFALMHAAFLLAGLALLLI